MSVIGDLLGTSETEFAVSNNRLLGQATAPCDLILPNRNGEIALDYNTPYPSGTQIDAAITGTAPVNQALVANTIRAHLWELRRNVTIVQARINVATPIAATSVRIGIYEIDPATFLPGPLVANSDAGVVDSSTAGVKALVFPTPIALPKGNYAIASLSNGAPTLRSLAQSALPPLPGADITMPTTRNTIWSSSVTFGPMPSPFSTNPSRASAAAAQILFQVA